MSYYKDVNDSHANGKSDGYGSTEKDSAEKIFLTVNEHSDTTTPFIPPENFSSLKIDSGNPFLLKMDPPSITTSLLHANSYNDDDAVERSDDYDSTDNDGEVDGRYLIEEQTGSPSKRTCEPELHEWYYVKPNAGVYRVDTDGSLKYVRVASGMKKLVKGGYGAMARNCKGNLICASSRVSDKGPISIVYHQLEGVREGIYLVKNNQFITAARLFCNSKFVYNLLCNPEIRKRYKAFDRQVVLAILDEIDGLLSSLPDNTIRFRCVRKGCNRAADYLSKCFKWAEMDSETCVKAGERKLQKLISDNFGQDLNSILYDDKHRKPFLYRK